MRTLWAVALALVACGEVEQGQLGPPVSGGSGGTEEPGTGGLAGTDGGTAGGGTAGTALAGTGTGAAPDAGGAAGAGGTGGTSLFGGSAGMPGGSAGGVSVAGVGGAGGAAGASPMTPCPTITACAAEPECLTTVSTDCTGCSLGFYSCGSHTGYFSTDGEEYACEETSAGYDCLAALDATTAKCNSCGGYVAPPPIECPSVDGCSGTPTCQLAASCPACELYSHVCTTGTTAYIGYFASDGARFECPDGDCVPIVSGALEHCGC